MATFTVTTTADSGAGSLRQAVLDANASPGRDVIVFNAAFDGGAEDIIRLTSGQIKITDRLKIDGGPGVTITGDAAGDDVTDAAGITDVEDSGARRLDDNSRIFDANVRLTLNGLTLTGGGDLGEDWQSGGAVRMTGDRLVLTNSLVSGNITGSSGGGIYNHLGEVVLRNSTVHGNSAYSYGGIDAGHVTLISSVVSNNSGGGIWGSNIVLKGSAIIDNSSQFGGGGVHGRNVKIVNSVISGNHADGEGGGIYGYRVSIKNSTISQNSARGDGGGIHVVRLDMANSSITNNSSSSWGGGIGRDYYSYPVMKIKIWFSTMTGNTSKNLAGGILCWGDLSLNNSIVLGNSAIKSSYDEAYIGTYGNLVLSGGNILGRDVFSGMTDIGDTTAEEVFAATVEIADGVRAGKLADNGGPTETIALKQSVFNPAVGEANPKKAPARDQRGEPRDAAPDLGAFEAGPVDGLVLLGGGKAEKLTGSARDDQIYARGGDDILWCLAGDDQLRGELGDDRLRGGDGDDALDGGAGDDSLRGGKGSDTLSGGAGNDRVRGGAGDDRLAGGDGHDTFVFAWSFGSDTIFGFDARPSGGQDRIDLRAFAISPDSFEDSVTIEDLGDDMGISIVGGGVILCRDVSGNGANAIGETDFVL